MVLLPLHLAALLGYCDPSTFLPNTDFYVPNQIPSVSLADAMVC